MSLEAADERRLAIDPSDAVSLLEFCVNNWRYWLSTCESRGILHIRYFQYASLLLAAQSHLWDHFWSQKYSFDWEFSHSSSESVDLALLGCSSSRLSLIGKEVCEKSSWRRESEAVCPSLVTRNWQLSLLVSMIAFSRGMRLIRGKKQAVP